MNQQKQAVLFEKLAGQKVDCQVCCHRCKINVGRVGRCGVRKNVDGQLLSLNYGRVVAINIDPIEKKPFYHFLPKTYTFSLATAGCNFRCLNCQNFTISQIGKEQILDKVPGKKMMPEEIVSGAIKNKCPSIAYTYSEPTIFVEYAYETMKLAKECGIKNVWVSNGYMSEQTIDLIAPYLDAINIDLKSMSDKFYKKVCGAKLQPVLDSLLHFKRKKVHLEVTSLIIPEMNDSKKELTEMAEFIYEQLGPETPWHLSAFYPTYLMNGCQPTSVGKIIEAVTIAKRMGLKNVYGGNI